MLFPEPDGPITTVNVPSAISTSTPSKARTICPPISKCFFSPTMRINGLPMLPKVCDCRAHACLNGYQDQHNNQHADRCFAFWETVHYRKADAQ